MSTVKTEVEVGCQKGRVEVRSVNNGSDRGREKMKVRRP